jgi:proline-specific peptidase
MAITLPKPARTGYIPFRGGRTFYKIFGSVRRGKTPLLILHGGPGSAHNYLLDLASLSKDRPVIFYDQFGCGKSSGRRKPSEWKTETFIAELDAVRNALKLDRIHLYGQSWGGMLAEAYMDTRPSGIVSVTFASAMVSIPLYQKELDVLKADLPPTLARRARKHEREGSIEDPEYLEAVREFEKRHLFRLPKFPERLSGGRSLSGKRIYRPMWGPNEMLATGTLKKWDYLKRMRKVTEPALVISGQYDELTPAQSVMLHERLPNSRLRIITAGSHSALTEQPRRYLSEMRSFLKSVE